MYPLHINELTIDRIAQWPLSLKAVLTGLIWALTGSVGYWLVISANLENLSVLRQAERQLKTTFETRQSAVSSLPAYKKAVQDMQHHVDKALKRLPKENEMPALLEAISMAGIETGLQCQLFAPQTEVPHDFYWELPIKMQLTGNYHQLATFLSRITTMKRIVTLHDFVIQKLTTEEDAPTESSHQAEDILEMTITAKIYWYRTL